MKRVKKEIRKRLDYLTGLNLNNKNLMKEISCQVITVAGYVMNVFNLEKSDLGELDMIVTSVSRDEKLYSKRNKGGRGLKSFNKVYDETKK